MEIAYDKQMIRFVEPRESTGAMTLFIGVGIVLLAGSATMGVLVAAGILGTDLLPVAIVPLLFGLLLLLSGRSRLKAAYGVTVTIDGHAQAVVYDHSRVDGTLRIGFGEIVKIYAYRRESYAHTASDTEVRRTVIRWVVQLELADGSSFWLATRDTREEAAELVAAISELTGHPGQIEGETVVPGDPDRVERYAAERAQLVSATSRFLVERQSDRGVAYTVTRTFSASDIVVLLIIAIMMGFVAVAASGLLSGEGFSPLGLIGALVPIGILAWMGLLLVRRYRLVLRPDEIVVELHFRPGYAKPGKTITIPRTALRSVRTNRLELGSFRLALGIDPEYDIPAASAMLANIGAFRRNAVSDDGGVQTLSLWELEPRGTAPFGADFRDLRYLERRIEQFYGMRGATA